MTENLLRNSLFTDTTLIMPNIWDVRSAQIARENGYKVIGTSSIAVSETLGGEDEERIDIDDVLSWNARIVKAVPDVAINVDLESGYGMDAKDLVAQIAKLGCAGVNIEDSNHIIGEQIHYEAQAARLSDIRQGLDALPGQPVLVARIDSMLDLIHKDGFGNSAEADRRVADCIERAHVYLASGADAVFPIGLNTPRHFRAFFRKVSPRQTSILIPFLDRRIAFFRDIGIWRISHGGTVREACDQVLQRELAQLSPNPKRRATLLPRVGSVIGRALLRGA